ncbi:hypothetical protein CHCC20441_2563 [Bacillus licheniformis]|uniref:Uncharacterized protein n=1 Tax=Bacillus licheniformis TaxID=1402 RepID=A0A8B5YDH5_BACLI|nr:hypothetical protein B4092_1486 [Bacillus licheniformis]TWN17689.1 hypothetical protein CHCC14564_2254 [Bacillus licheniformis LMG 17339]KYC82414.1 hypothetical protein B4090_1053 [Bacillus licheniformis]KYC84975.1 hypothetical protein B4091_1036 [Bacillus licheniformis]KYC93943.1 hypothetical protein B4164_1243 [Bacillus licheniformis]
MKVVFQILIFPKKQTEKNRLPYNKQPVGIMSSHIFRR